MVGMALSFARKKLLTMLISSARAASARDKRALFIRTCAGQRGFWVAVALSYGLFLWGFVTPRQRG